ncbi:winged helix-turn-helix transcriptional regulator [Microbispora triticiradicis]|uniref:Winged helix-turn-helix transcriptional regulator n=1 Tax=Microbispora triticiradicis TaxID=2200763 RepID=A0ABX9LLE4_9ACTN|nr:AAA family ATPase [Microbispora triticiradicis]RGA04488.1 winged helix-turn-helix transcriptional regulator [Microbispora triticiradicis]
MKRKTADRCPTPPHADHAVRAEAPATTEDERTEGVLRQAARWVMEAPAERAPLPGGAALYGAGWLANYYHLPWWGLLTVGAAGTIVSYAMTLNRAGDGWRTWGNTAAAASAGAWLTAADVVGPVAGPSGLMSWIFGGAFGVGYGLHWLGLSGVGRDRRPKRVKGETPRIDWEAYFDGWGMSGARVISSAATRLGERALISTKGTGKRASTFCTKAMAERIAEDFDTKKSRVIIREGEVAGQIEISVRLRDPWAAPILHPLLDPEPEIELPEVADARRPLVVGQDPETGKPLEFVVWDEDGAAHWLIVAIKGGGKTVLLNNVLERLTAADNATVWGIDVSKAKDLRRWRDSGALDLAACGPAERERAVVMLELAAAGVGHRAEHNTEAVFDPRPGHPLHVIVVDEIDALVAPGDALAQRAVVALQTITSKGRSESVGLIIVGQRGTAQWMGGANIRANLDRQALLKLARASEANNAVGDAAVDLPNMAKYGEGKPGVVALTAAGSLTGLGRTFMLKELDEVEELGTGREPSEFEPDLVEFWGERYAALKAGDLPASAPTAEATRPAAAGQAAPTGGQARPHLFLVPTPSEEEAARVRAHSAARWQMFRAVQQAVTSAVPTDQERQILALVRRDGGAAMAEITEAIGYSESQTLRWMNDLRELGLVELRGKGRGARWHAPADDAADDDPQSRAESLHGIAP